MLAELTVQSTNWKALLGHHARQRAYSRCVRAARTGASTNVSSPAGIPNPSRIIELASAFYGSCTLFTASDLGIFAKLAELGPSDSAILAKALDLSPRGAELLFKIPGAAAIGLLKKEGVSYSTTRRSLPSSSSPAVPAICHGQSATTATYITPGASFLFSSKLASRSKGRNCTSATIPERTRTFVLSMYGRAMGIGRSVVPQLELTGRKQLLDIGGGPGAYSTLIAQANPGITCTVLDLPAVAAVASELIAHNNIADRVKILPGDYHTTPFPGGNDAVIIFGVLHQESPASIQDILHRAFASLAPGGILHILDMMTDASHTAPPFSALFGLNMALTTQNGWVFSSDELGGWIKAAGFDDFSVRPLPPPMPHWLATATKR